MHGDRIEPLLDKVKSQVPSFTFKALPRYPGDAARAALDRYRKSRHAPVPTVFTTSGMGGAKEELPEEEISELHPEAMPLNRKHMDDGFPRYPKSAVRSMSIRSQPEDACFSCLRTTVHCYNIIVLILGLGVLGVGIWLLVTEFSVREVSVLIGFNYFEIGTYLMIGAGGTIALLAFCGCCGTMREDRFVLAFYGVTLTLTLFALIAGSALAFISLGFTVTVKDTISNTLQTSYGVDLRKNSTNRLITDAWDSVQRGLECCGVHGDANGTYSWAFYKLHSQWYIQTNMRAPYVPESCCRSGSKPLCTGVETINGPPAKGPPMEASYVKNEFLFTDGCYEKIVKNVERNALILGCVAAFVPLLLIIGIVIVFCLCARVRSESYYDEEEL
ncbi:tetraspanin-18-like isoform X2 [Mya arenaria]|uniref:tetraspanin-18-like isoform X2 n=1 Tax=Mya arenaria TaxID=6604 RepID=UPI0022E93E0A|nr:tetraspanin-18-like isoform X2 [Mya arenaria]